MNCESATGPDASQIESEILENAKKKALHHLSYRDLTEAQLREKLEAGEFPPPAIDAAVEYVRSYHYIDDKRYADQYVRAKKAERSVFEMREELRRRGVQQELVDEAIGSGEVDETETVRTLFLKKFGRKDLSDPKLYEKALRYFAGKRFPYGAAKDGIRSALEEIGEQ